MNCILKLENGVNRRRSPIGLYDISMINADNKSRTPVATIAISCGFFKQGLLYTNNLIALAERIMKITGASSTLDITNRKEDRKSHIRERYGDFSSDMVVR